MLYHTNQDLAADHHVSVRTVRNWIESAREGKLELTLHRVGQRDYIANISKNALIINDLVNKGKKYRPHRSQKTVMPQSKFYDLYTQEQIYDIVSNLEINREIPNQYNYFGKGADNWNSYMDQLTLDESQNTLNSTTQLLGLNQKYLDKLLAKYVKINVIDIGVGNGYPVKELLAHLLEIGKLDRYIAVDISPQMLQLAEKNIQEWFGGKVSVECNTLDIDHERFSDLLFDDFIKADSAQISNVVLFFGGTIQNFRNPSNILRNIHDSIGIHDIFIHQQKLDTQSSRQFFDFGPTTSATKLAPMDRHIFDLLNVDDTLYESVMGYNADLKERHISVKFNKAVSIRFMFDDGERIVDFNKDDQILLWRARHYRLKDMLDLLDDGGFSPFQISQTPDQMFAITISRIKHD